MDKQSSDVINFTDHAAMAAQIRAALIAMELGRATEWRTVNVGFNADPSLPCFLRRQAE